MKREDHQNAQREESAENKNENHNQQNIQTKDVSNNQQNTNFQQAGLGRDRMMNIEDQDDNYAGEDNDLRNEDLNASNDQ